MPVTPRVLAVAVVSFILGSSVTFAILRWLEKDASGLMFVVGAILGTQMAAIAHHRIPGATNSAAIKAWIGAALAITAVAMGLLLHVIFAPFQFVEITVPISAVGSFVFPFVLFNTMWKALSKKPG